MARRLLIIASMLVFSISTSSAQTPSPEAMTAARSLVTTMKVADPYKAMLPATLMGLRRTLTQDRPEIERDYDAMMPTIEAAFTPYYAAIVDDIATVYANNSRSARCARSSCSTISRSARSFSKNRLP